MASQLGFLKAGVPLVSGLTETWRYGADKLFNIPTTHALLLFKHEL